MYLHKLIGSFFLFCGLSGGLEFNITKCVKTCSKERIYNDEDLCKTTCLQDSLKELAKRGYKRKLPQPVVPIVLKAGWQTIQLSFNTAELANYSGVDYILEVKPHWGIQERDDVFNVFPYLRTYHHTKQMIYLVEDLEPNAGYQFRVIAVRTNDSSGSEFSDWGKLTYTTKNCTKWPCGVTNIRVELTRKIPDKIMTKLNSTFFWEPTTLPRNYYTNGYKGNGKISRLARPASWCYHYFKSHEYTFQDALKKKDFFTNQNVTNYKPKKDQFHLYYDCWYKFELWVQTKPLFGKELVKRSWIFHIPDCITVNDFKTCGCPYVVSKTDKTHSVLNVTVETLNASSSLAHLKWSNLLWRNDINITYYLVVLYKKANGRMPKWSTFYDAHLHIHYYNMTIPNLETGQEYTVQLSAFHDDHCIHHDKETLDFFAISVCKNATCPANSTCRPILYTDRWKCQCDDEFAWVEMQQICIPLEKCQLSQEGCDTTEVTDSTADNEAIIAGVVPALAVVILISTGIILWLRYFHRKRMHFIQREFEDALGTHGNTLTNPYDYQSPIGLEMLPESSNKEMNLLYISQENLVIPDDLLESINLFELPGDLIRLRSMIGRGAFGEVYIGEARRIHKNPEWVTVAIKTLTESVKEDEVHDFLREIELMKTLGQHENVIQMYGCCTQSRPICLVLEYATGGNLLNYLRSLKRKCQEIAAARAYAMMKSEKEKYQKFFEPGELPDDSTSYSFPNDPYKRPGTEIKETEAVNLEVAASINEELRTALDSKELESFARQIACGMEHVSGLGIVHRDLAARNILLGENKVLKISDFGLSREGTYVKQTEGKIPFRWLSIEAIVQRLYSSASDVWAFGIVLWEICTLGNIPYPTVSDKELTDFLLSGKRMEKEKSCTDDIYKIMLKCWSHLPEDRPSFSELSKSLWDLEHEGNTYVNVGRLMEESVDGQGNEDQKEVQKENNNIDDKSEESDLAVKSNTGVDNLGFCLSAEDLNVDDDRQLIRKKKKSTSEKTPSQDKGTFPGRVGNGVTNEIDSSNAAKIENCEDEIP